MDFTTQLMGKGLIKEMFMLRTKIFTMIPDLDCLSQLLEIKANEEHYTKHHTNYE